jgi:hypothetical protein
MTPDKCRKGHGRVQEDVTLPRATRDDEIPRLSRHILSSHDTTSLVRGLTPDMSALGHRWEAAR